MAIDPQWKNFYEICKEKWAEAFRVEDVLAQQKPDTREYTDEDIWRIQRNAFEAGVMKQKAIENLKAAPKKEPLPIHRAIANHNRVGDVFAHHVYWLKP